MLAECKNCGAPLDIEGDPAVVECSYCGRRNRLRKMKTLAPVTPQNWRPPETWSSPKGAQPLRYRGAPKVASAIGCGSLLFTFLILSIVLVSVAVPMIAVFGSPLGPFAGSFPQLEGLQLEGLSLPGLGWDGSAPFRCGGNQTVHLRGITADLPGETAITVEQNCELILEDSTITAWQGIEADGNRRVVLRNVTIAAEGVGIRVSGNKELELHGSEVRAGEEGILARHNVRVIVAGGRVKGSPAIVHRHRRQVENRDAEIVDVGRGRRGSHSSHSRDSRE